MIASYDLFTGGYTPETGAQFDRQIVAALEAQPGIQSVALSNRVLPRPHCPPRRLTEVLGLYVNHPHWLVNRTK
jgi:hypothetical protein